MYKPPEALMSELRSTAFTPPHAVGLFSEWAGTLFFAVTSTSSITRLGHVWATNVSQYLRTPGCHPSFLHCSRLSRLLVVKAVAPLALTCLLWQQNESPLMGVVAQNFLLSPIWTRQFGSTWRPVGPLCTCYGRPMKEENRMSPEWRETPAELP